jgi:hypothetical protein
MSIEKKIALCGLFLITIFAQRSLYAQGQEAQKTQKIKDNGTKEKDASALSLKEKKLSFFEKNSDLTKDALDLRDPFKRKKIRLRKGEKTLGGGYLKDNAYSNTPKVGSTGVDQIKIVGILLGKKRTAIARRVDSSGIAQGPIFYLKEGMKIGDNKAEIKAILPGGILLVEKILNVYDQEEYIETVIPVSGAVK